MCRITSVVPFQAIENDREFGVRSGLVNQLENIIEDVIATIAIREQLEHLSVIHWPLLLINLSLISA